MTANRLKQAALALFSASGYDGVSLSEIAREVGIKTPSIYAHFESKEQLFLALMTDEMRAEHERFAALTKEIADLEPLEQLYAAFKFFTDLDHLTNGQAFMKRTLIVPPKHLQEQLRAQFLEHEAVYSRYFLQLFSQYQAGSGSEPDGNRELVGNCVIIGGSGSVGQRLLVLFYALIDGLLVEHKFYDSEIYRQRQSMIWDWIVAVLSKKEGGQ